MVDDLKEKLLKQWNEIQYGFVNKFDSNEYDWMELDFSELFKSN
jgi:hypothetical protein